MYSRLTCTTTGQQLPEDEGKGQCGRDDPRSRSGHGLRFFNDAVWNNKCCNVDVKWTKYPSYLTDLQRWAKTVEANVHVSKLCILNGTQTVSTASGFVVDQTIGHASFASIGKRCSPADIDVIVQVVSALTCSKSPYLSKCHYFCSSPSCGGARGPCTEWNTMSEFWPLCDNPSLNTSWSVELDA
jgi:hypothetical protein